MISATIQEAFNQHINFEYFSSYLYLSMSAWFDGQGLKGCAHWMRLQADEEALHVGKFFDFQLERGGDVDLRAIEAPEKSWDSPLAAFQAAYDHECLVTGRINKLVDSVLAESDHAANAFLQWFVTEQVEEEANVLDIVGQLKLVEGDGRGLLMIDQELAKRVPTPPAA